MIATRTPGLDGFFEHGMHGLFVPPGDPEALRTAIARLSDDPEEAERMGGAARALVEERHSLDIRIARLAAIINDAPREYAPSSHGSLARSSTGLPANVRFTSPTLFELRELYARSRFVVVPVKDVDYDAGSTVVAEAMAMGKAVIASWTRGLASSFDHGVHGLFVPAGDADALRAAIVRLCENPGEVERMGAAARALVEERHSLDIRIARLATIINGSPPS